MVRKRVTVWPGMRVPLPPVERYPNCGLWESDSGVWLRAHHQDFVEGGDDSRLVFVLDGTRVAGDLYLDLYLRGLNEVDLENPATVAEFVRRYGWVEAPRWDEFGELREGILRPQVVEAAREDNGRLAEVRAAHGGQYWDKDYEDVDETFLESPRQVGRTLMMVRDVTTLYLAVTSQLSAEDASLRLADGNLAPEALSDQPEWCLHQLLDVGLRPFHVSVDVRDPDVHYMGRAADPWGDPVDLFNVLCLALANDIADGADFKKCANETCDQIFTRHRGRATQGKYHMTGVKYCSVECARAQKQREYRRRQRQKGAKP